MDDVSVTRAYLHSGGRNDAPLLQGHIVETSRAANSGNNRVAESMTLAAALFKVVVPETLGDWRTAQRVQLDVHRQQRPICTVTAARIGHCCPDTSC